MATKTDWTKRVKELFLVSPGNPSHDRIMGVLREFAEEAAEFADKHPDQIVSIGEPGSGQFRAWSTVGDYLRAMLPPKKED